MESAKLHQIYQNRRKELYNKIDKGILLISESKSAPDPNLKDKNLLYLVGQVPKGSILLHIPAGVFIDHRETINTQDLGRGKKVSEILFIPQDHSPFKRGDDRQSQFQELSGCEVVKWTTEFPSILARSLIKAKKMWINLAYIPSLTQPLSAQHALIKEIRERFPWITIDNIAPIIHEMRWVKDDYEIECLRQAFQIQSEIYIKIMQKLKPGVNESVGKAIYDYEISIRDPLKVSGTWHDHYQSNIIVAAGKNALGFHYMDNNCLIEDNDLVLIDAGVQYCGYSSDITRTFPANGIFTEEQRKLYEIVLEAEKAAIAALIPGNTQRDAHLAAFKVFEKHQLAEYCYANAGHAVGLNIHDANDWGVSDRPLKPGCVIVVEPQVKIPEKNIGIRIEDGVLITAQGPELLPAPPKEIHEIEKICRSK